MNILVSAVLSSVRLRFGDLTDAAGLLYMQEGRSQILARLRLREATITITTLAVGTAEYDLDEVMRSVDQVRYRRSATADDFKVLTPTSKENLYARFADWRKLDNAEPEYFSLGSNATGANILLVPAPDTASTGSPAYPRLEIDGEQDETLTTASTLVDDLPNADVYVTYVKMRYSEDNHPEDLEYWVQRHEKAISAAQAHLQNKNRHKSAAMNPDYMSRRRGSV